MWRLASLLSLLIASASIVSTVVVPLRRTGYARGMLRSAAGRYLVNAGSTISVLLLPINALGVPFSPGFALYYASIGLSFAVGFILFADAVLLEDDG